MNWLRKLWWGAYPLHVAFWIFYVCGFVVTILVGGLLLFFLTPYGLRPIGFVVAAVLYWAYVVATTVGVWQSAGPRMKSPIWMDRVWAIGARAVVALVALRFVWRVIDGGSVPSWSELRDLWIFSGGV